MLRFILLVLLMQRLSPFVQYITQNAVVTIAEQYRAIQYREQYLPEQAARGGKDTRRIAA